MTPSQTSKIHVTWPPGCYGSYIMQSIYAYSNLGYGNKFIIDQTGSSHTFRKSETRRKYFVIDHAMSDNADIIISSAAGHELDYFVNQFIKEELSNVPAYLTALFPDFKFQISEQWNSNEDWAAREWISFWLPDCFAAAYPNNINADLTTAQLFDINEDIFPELIIGLIKKLGLSVNADIDIIKTNHADWQKQQRYHNLQKRCDKWISEIINTHEDTPSPCITILDEAYVQSRLREHGYEIRCFELNVFPKTSNKLRSLLYKETQDDTATKTEDC